MLEALSGVERCERGAGRDSPADRVFASVSTDSRQLDTGALFVALRGERFDAHAFLQQAAERGAAGAVVEHIPEAAPPLDYYVVPDTLTALGELARFRRRALPWRVCAIAGSNGKTSTKEMIRAIAASAHTVHATHGNQNNLIGTPLTLLSAPASADVLVVEVGTNAPGEVARLAHLVEPDIAVITGISEEHLEGLGDLDGVLREETALLHALPADGLAVVADTPPALPERARALANSVRVAGWSAGADATLRATDIRVDTAGGARFKWQDTDVVLPVCGRVQVRNALLALAVGASWGIDAETAAAALASVEPPPMRGEMLSVGQFRVLADCYNANPASVRAAVETLLTMPTRGLRVAVVGTMGELGRHSERLHREVAQTLAESHIDVIVATGAFAPALTPWADALGDRLILEPEPLQGFAKLSERLHGDETILLKASRSMALERLIPRLESFAGAEREQHRAAAPCGGAIN